MSTDRQRIISERLWLRSANVMRDALKAELDRLFSGYGFLEQSANFSYGQMFWARVESVPYERGRSLNDVLDQLGHAHIPILWWHRHSSDVGALKVRLDELVAAALKPGLRPRWGADLLFADEEMSLGVCHEVDEDGARFRWWAGEPTCRRS